MTSMWILSSSLPPSLSSFLPLYVAIRRQRAWSCCPNIYAAVWLKKLLIMFPQYFMRQSNSRERLIMSQCLRGSHTSERLVMLSQRLHGSQTIEKANHVVLMFMRPSDVRKAGHVIPLCTRQSDVGGVVMLSQCLPTSQEAIWSNKLQPTFG